MGFIQIEAGSENSFDNVIDNSSLCVHDKDILKRSNINYIAVNPDSRSVKINFIVDNFIKDISLTPLREQMCFIFPDIKNIDLKIDYNITKDNHILKQFSETENSKKKNNGFNKYKKNELSIINNITDTPVLIKSISEDNINKNLCLQGFISISPKLTVTRTKKKIINFILSDHTESIKVQIWDKRDGSIFDKVKKLKWIKLIGKIQKDFNSKDFCVQPSKIASIKSLERIDNEEEKRVEFHIHTKMSAMDATINLKELIKTAAKWKHPAISITDHGVIHQFPKFYNMCKKEGIKPILGLEGYLIDDTSLKNKDNWKELKRYHIIILVKNKIGLKNLYKLVSLSHIEYFYKKPCIPKTEITKLREGLILGSACEIGEVFQNSFLYFKQNKEIDENFENIIKFYDFLEIQPLTNNEFMIRKNKVESKEELKNINKFIYEAGKKYNIPVVATTDAHFLNPEDSILRKILQAGQGYKDYKDQPGLFFRTTKEMLDEFSYFNDDIAKEIVVKNPIAIFETIEDVPPVPKGFYPPKIDGAEEQIKEMVMNTAHNMYGDKLPEIVQKRIDKELNSIINNKFSVLFLIAQKVVKKSLDMGYLVGSRGSVGSSFIATLCNITEVNPLPAHYLCLKCKYSEFHNEKSCGVDLKDKKCPECGENLSKQGFSIPFETFMGFSGEKVPDIDLNFSGNIQVAIHKYAEELFGKGHAFKAGTISTIAEKSSGGFVYHYFEDNGIHCSDAEKTRLKLAGTGIKKSTGQHPGGIIVVPDNKEIYDFCPIQRPANDMSSNITTTHFEYHDMESQLVKLDLLGHDDPTFIRMLMDITGVKLEDISLDDKKTMEETFINVKTLGIPEFNTNFVREMVKDAKPKEFADLISLSGLSHGTDVWIGNAQELIKKNIATLNEVISTRDEIMNYLIQKGVPNSQAFKIMESVRKGRGLTDEWETLMLDHNVPQWYINSCRKIKYMFPKAHAAAYVMMAYRIAYFKTHYPLEFYSTYFTVKASDFDANKVIHGIDEVKNEMNRIKRLGKDAQTKEKALFSILEVVEEMMEKGFSFLPVDIYRSEPTKFGIEDKSLRCSFDSLPGVGTNAAKMIYEAAKRKSNFLSIEDIKVEANVSNSVIEVLKEHGCLSELPEKNQLTLF